jgi:hypothetical protein
MSRDLISSSVRSCVARASILFDYSFITHKTWAGDTGALKFFYSIKLRAVPPDLSSLTVRVVILNFKVCGTPGYTSGTRATGELKL